MKDLGVLPPRWLGYEFNSLFQGLLVTKSDFPTCSVRLHNTADSSEVRATSPKRSQRTGSIEKVGNREINLIRDRYRGSILGLAVGDALGAPVEFKRPGSFEPVTDMSSGGAFGLRPGQWTDDTSLALCLAESLVETNGFDLIDQLDRYVRWYREGHLSSTGECFDIGNTTKMALNHYEETKDPHSGPTGPATAGTDRS